MKPTMLFFKSQTLMLVFLCHLVCAETSHDGGEGSFGPITQGCQISIRTDQMSYTFDQSICLKLTLRNVGDSAFTVANANVMDVYRFDLRLPNGKACPFTLAGKLRAGFSGRRFPIFDPGQSESASIFMLNHFYDMSLLGEYTLTVYRNVSGKSGEWVQVPSNTLKIVVHDREVEQNTPE